MAKLTRFGVAMDKELLECFDRFLAGKGYQNRSEAIRDLVRNALIQEAWEQAKGEVIAIIALIYDHEVRGLSDRLTDIQHHSLPLLISTLHVHLDERHCLEVIVVRGKAEPVREFAHRLLAIKGILHGGIVATGVPIPHHKT